MAEALYLDAETRGKRFALFHRAVGLCKGRVLFLHPFAEEMNKSRRMAALQSRALAAAGFAVLQLDLFGCGDSSGDFGEASWQDWLDDARLGVDWLDAQAGDAPLWLWGLRAGCLLASQTAADLTQATRQLWWQPPASGKLLAQQWLRLKLAAELIGNAAKGAAAELQQQLRAGQSVEVAGYCCGARLLLGLEQAELVRPAGQLIWLELSRAQPATLSPVAERTLQSWRHAGASIHAQALDGPAFWHSTEIATAPALLAASLAALEARR